MSHSEQPRRTRLRAETARGGRLGVLAALVAAILLAAMIVAASLGAPGDAAGDLLAQKPPATSPGLPTPTIAPDEPLPTTRFYVSAVRFDYNDPIPRMERFVEAYQEGQRRMLFRIDGGYQAELSEDGSRLFVLSEAGLQAIDTRAGTAIWSRPLLSGADQELPARMALSPDERTLAVYRADPAAPAPGGSPAPRAILSWFAADTGQPTGESIQLPPFRAARTLQIAADGTPYLCSEFRIQALNRRTGAATTIRESGEGGLQAVWSPDRRLLYVLDGERQVSVIDAMTRAQRSQAALDEALFPGFQSRLGQASALADGRLAVVVHFNEQPTIELQRLSRFALASRIVALVDPISGTILASRTDELADYSGGAARGGGGAPDATVAAYEFSNQTVRSWDRDSEHASNVVTLTSSDQIIDLIVAPPLRFVGQSGARLAGRVPAAAALGLGPTLPALLGEGSAPFAWVWQRGDQAAPVVAYAPDGSQRTLASKVVDIIERPQAPPLILTAPDENSWALVDPAVGITTPIDLPLVFAHFVDMDNDTIRPRLALSPDGKRLAFLTAPFLDSESARAMENQLAIADIASGRTVVITDATAWGLPFAGLGGWTDDGLYLETLAGTDHQLWRLDLAAPDALSAVAGAERVLEAGSADMLVINGAAGLAIVEPHPADARHSQLILYDLRARSQQVIYEGLYVDIGAIMIDPAGRSVAYLNVSATSDQTALMLYERADGSTRQLALGRGYGALKETAEGQSFVFRTSFVDDEERASEDRWFGFDGTQGLRWNDPEGASQSQAILDSRATGDGRQVVDLLITEDRRRMILRRFAVGDQARLDLAVPVSGIHDEGYGAFSIVYLP